MDIFITAAKARFVSSRFNLDDIYFRKQVRDYTAAGRLSGLLVLFWVQARFVVSGLCARPCTGDEAIGIFEKRNRPADFIVVSVPKYHYHSYPVVGVSKTSAVSRTGRKGPMNGRRRTFRKRHSVEALFCPIDETRAVTVSRLVRPNFVFFCSYRLFKSMKIVRGNIRYCLPMLTCTGVFFCRCLSVTTTLVSTLFILSQTKHTLSSVWRQKNSIETVLTYSFIHTGNPPFLSTTQIRQNIYFKSDFSLEYGHNAYRHHPTRIVIVRVGRHLFPVKIKWHYMYTNRTMRALLGYSCRFYRVCPPVHISGRDLKSVIGNVENESFSRES